MSANPDKPGGEVVVYQTEDGRNRILVRLEDETVWLTQVGMAELYQTTVANINTHEPLAKFRQTCRRLANKFLATAYFYGNISVIDQIVSKIDLRLAFLSVLEHSFASASRFAPLKISRRRIR